MQALVTSLQWSTPFRALVAAELNVADGCDPCCKVRGAIAGAQQWLADYPAGTPVAASSCALGQG